MGVIVFGQSHNQAGILVEPKPEYAIDVEDEDQLIEFRNLLWFVHLPKRHLSIKNIFLQANYR